MKKTKLYKPIALLLSAVFIANMSTQTALGIAPSLSEGLSSLLAQKDTETVQAPTSVDDIRVPSVTTNPYTLENNGFILPVYNSTIYNYMNPKGIFSGYHSFSRRTNDRSQYYTGSLLTLGNYTAQDGYNPVMYEKESLTVESSLPYTEERTEMFHPDVTASGDGSIYIDMEVGSSDEDEPLGEDILKYLDPEQLSINFHARFLSGAGGVFAIRRTDGGSQRYNHYVDRLKGGSTEAVTLNVPIGADAESILISYDLTKAVVTDMYAALIDNSAPYIKGVDFAMEKGLRGDEADLIMTVEFNEGIRFASEYKLEEEFANAYVTVSLWNATQGRYQNIRLYLQKVDGTNKIVFRGNLGLLHYCNLEVKGITKTNIPAGTHRFMKSGFIDLVDGMVLGTDIVKSYGNGNITASSTVTNGITDMPMLSDHAGNGVDMYALTKFKLGTFKFYADSFEAEQVRIYNDKTLGVSLGEIDASTAEEGDAFVGPSRDLTVHVYTDRVLDEEVWKQVYITLNILDADGEPLKVYATSAIKYTNDETYADGSKTGMLLKFENIPLSADMTLDVDATPDAEGNLPLPVVKVTGMGTDYSHDETGYPTAYPYVPDPYDKIYADFTAPTVTVRKTTSSEATVESETEADADAKYYMVTVETVIEDMSAYSHMAGLVGGTAALSIGGGVEKETKIRYVMSTDLAPPEDISAYTYEAILAPDTMITTGSFTMLNNREAMYVHILVESGGIYLNTLYTSVSASDLVGNSVVTDPRPEVEYIIDEVPPVASVVSYGSVVGDENTTITLSVNVSATDHSRIDRLLYCFGSDSLTGSEEWKVAVIDEFATTVTSTIEKTYGDGTQSAESNRIYTETLWIKAIDTYGNESTPVGHYVRLSLEKPSTVASYTGDGYAVDRTQALLVSGPALSGDGETAYTRVTITPLDDETYSYVTLVKTGEEDVDVLALAGRQWYRVKLGRDGYEEVSGPVDVANDTGGILDGLVSIYGDIKVSFENGYGDMVPVEGEAFSDAPRAGSYFADPNYYTLRYASPLAVDKATYGVDFGAIIDCAVPFNSEKVTVQVGGTTVVADADKGADPYVFYQQYKGISPMRNAQIHFSISNIANSSYGLLDFDYASSRAELMRVGEDGGADTVVATQTGLWATGSQYFTIGNTTDSGEYFTSGAYYLRVTVVNGAGHEDVFESSRIVLDAQSADTAGIWEYSYGSVADVTQTPDSAGRFEKKEITATDSAFTDIGISVSVGGETSRDRFFATYTYGVNGLTLVLSAPDTERVYEGITVGEVEGFKMWNLLSAPTAAEIEAKYFEISEDGTLVRDVNTQAIYTSETIPTGILGMSRLFLVKGTNTICYQVKMKNGYVSPIRQFTVTVSDQTPELTVIIDGYQPSINPSQLDGVINADHVRYLVDTAYSVNGSGEVNVSLWSRYDMNLGLFGENGNLTEHFIGGTTGAFKVLRDGMKPEEYADFTRNSYTANFPYESTAHCSAVFVAEDDYGGVTIVAPQLGDLDRVDVDAQTVKNAHEIEINYTGEYFDDPFDPNDDPYAWRVLYNQPTYFGNTLLSLETYLVENTENGEVRSKDIQTDTGALRYNQFNICSNDISLGSAYEHQHNYGVSIHFDDITNGDLVLLSDATVTLSGGHIGENPITLTLLEGDVVTTDASGNETVATGLGNTVGFMYGGSFTSGDISYKYFYLAYPQADDTHKVGDTETLHYKFEYCNVYGDTFTQEGDVTIKYIDYKVTGVTMTESGAKLTYSFAAKDTNNAGVERTGKFSNGTYQITVPDYFGGNGTYEYTVDNEKDAYTDITYEKYLNTAEPVVINLKGTYDIYVDITDYELMEILNDSNGTKDVTVKVYGNTRMSYRYIDADGKEQTYFIDVNNIYETDPKAVYSYEKDDYNTAEDGTKYRYGSVTVYLTDGSFTLRDKFTGETPSFTFLPGGERTYTFKKEDIVALLGDETVELDEDITAVLDIVLYEVPEVEFTDGEDKETPNVQIRAFSQLNGMYTDSKLSMTLTSVRDSKALTQYAGYEIFKYIGNRGSMADVLDRLCWSTSYRFIVETVDSSRVRLFVKEGLYADAPDFETGKSDVIEGVKLNSKLLTVTKNAKFTLFVVDSANNYSSIPFNITNVSAAPVPTVVKVPMSHDTVRLYVIPPESVPGEDFRILPPIEYSVDADVTSEYYLEKYIEIKSNDDYDVIYEMKYGGSVITDALSGVSVTEISLDEITMQGLAWSANKAEKATPNPITVDIKFSHDIAKVVPNASVDADKVSLTVAGSTVRVTYTDNCSAISFVAYAANGTYVTVSLDSVTNIDKSAPVIEFVSDELAANGKSLTLVLAANELASFKEGYGRWGEKVTENDGTVRYYYTIVITENREYTYTFADESGIQTTFTYVATKLVLDELDALYNTSPSDEGAVSDPEKLSLETGDTVYIKPERDVTAEITGLEPLKMTGGEWFALTIPETVGGIPPYVILTDDYGNVLTHQFSKVEVPDTRAPEIIVSKLTYPVKVGTERALIEAELIANFIAFDDGDGEVSLAVQFTEDTDVMGLTDVIYTATDSVGNVATAYGKLRLMSIYEPVVYVGETRVIRDEGIHLKSGEPVTLSIDTQGIAYKVILANGKRTAAQLKGMEAAIGYTTADTAELGVLSNGMYTVLIVTEQRDYFRILIAVENF